MTTTTPSGLAAYAREARRLPYPPARRAIRIAAGVSQQLVADELGVDRATVTRYELGERTPRGELLIAYIRLLDELKEAVAA